MDLNDLTIVLPTRNEAANLPAFLQSLPAEVSLIVVDDSDDSSPDLIRQLRPDNTSVIRRPGNVTLARQVGADAADTPWLLFTDADVTFAPNYFSRLNGYSSVAAIYGPKLSRDKFIRYYGWFERGQRLAHGLGIPAVSGSNLLVSRRAFQAINGFDLRLSCNEDSELGWRLKRAGFPIKFAPELVVYARDHRRLERGWGRKIAHTLVRCGLLYFNLMPSRWRGSDWGYWSYPTGGTTRRAHP